MKNNGCENCRYCKCYHSNSYWDPDEYECVGFERDIDVNLTQEQFDDIMERCWTNDERWADDDEPICPAYEQRPLEDPEETYWAEYAYHERFDPKPWEQD